MPPKKRQRHQEPPDPGTHQDTDEDAEEELIRRPASPPDSPQHAASRRLSGSSSRSGSAAQLAAPVAAVPLPALHSTPPAAPAREEPSAKAKTKSKKLQTAQALAEKAEKARAKAAATAERLAAKALKTGNKDVAEQLRVLNKVIDELDKKEGAEERQTALVALGGLLERFPGDPTLTAAEATQREQVSQQEAARLAPLTHDALVEVCDLASAHAETLEAVEIELTSLVFDMACTEGQVRGIVQGRVEEVKASLGRSEPAIPVGDILVWRNDGAPPAI